MTPQEQGQMPQMPAQMPMPQVPAQPAQMAAGQAVAGQVAPTMPGQAAPAQAAQPKKKGKKFSEMHLSDLAPGKLLKNLKGDKEAKEEAAGMVPETTLDFEVNLIPDVKLDLIRTIRMRNYILLAAIVVMGISWGLVALLGSVYTGQSVMMASKDSRIEAMSKKMNDYSELTEFLTIQDQMGKVEEITENRHVLSRVFSILSVILPSNGDTITISKLSMDMQSQRMMMEAQANAGTSPDIDYRVLESFKKAVALTKYDYGRYVDAEGNVIPTRCIVETNSNGQMLSDKGNVYAVWKRGRTGCDPTRDDYTQEEEKGQEETEGTEQPAETEQGGEEQPEEEEVKKDVPDEVIYRTPQFNAWYTDKAEGKKVWTYADTKKTVKAHEYSGVAMSLDGKISNLPHFESQCTEYSGQIVKDSKGKQKAQWTATNESCMLATEEGIQVRDSSNGRDSNGNLVLAFNADLTLSPQVLKFTNKHMMAVGPTKENVTDSYAQIESMFAERARDCSETDTTCKNNKANAGE